MRGGERDIHGDVDRGLSLDHGCLLYQSDQIYLSPPVHTTLIDNRYLKGGRRYSIPAIKGDIPLKR